MSSDVCICDGSQILIRFAGAVAVFNIIYTVYNIFVFMCLSCPWISVLKSWNLYILNPCRHVEEPHFVLWAISYFLPEKIHIVREMEDECILCRAYGAGAMLLPGRTSIIGWLSMIGVVCVRCVWRCLAPVSLGFAGVLQLMTEGGRKTARSEHLGFHQIRDTNPHKFSTVIMRYR